MPHPNNKQNKNTNPIISREDYHLTQLCPSEEKNNSALFSPYMKLTQTPESNLGGQKPKGKNNSTLKSGKRRPQTKKKKEEEEGRRKKEEGRRRRRSTQYCVIDFQFIQWICTDNLVPSLFSCSKCPYLLCGISFKLALVYSYLQTQ